MHSLQNSSNSSPTPPTGTWTKMHAGIHHFYYHYFFFFSTKMLSKRQRHLCSSHRLKITAFHRPLLSAQIYFPSVLSDTFPFDCLNNDALHSSHPAPSTQEMKTHLIFHFLHSQTVQYMDQLYSRADRNVPTETTRRSLTSCRQSLYFYLSLPFVHFCICSIQRRP